MNEREAETLASLSAGLRFDLSPETGEIASTEGWWFRPQDVGGSSGSHHSQTLRRLVAKGWVEHKDRSAGMTHRPSHLYRITLAGAKARAAYAVTAESAGAGERSRPSSRPEAG